MWAWRVKMPIANSKLDVVTVSDVEECVSISLERFWRWRLFKIMSLRFGQDFEVEVKLRSWSWGLVKILMLNLVKIFRLILWLKIGQHFEPEVWPRFGSWSLVEILKLNFDNFWHDLKAVSLGKANNPWVCCAFDNVWFHISILFGRWVMKLAHSADWESPVHSWTRTLDQR